MDIADLKRQAAWRAVEFVESGMVVGLGHGSTAAFAVERIAELLRAGELKDILCVPCSEEVARHAERLGIPLTTLDESPSIDLTIDGAPIVKECMDRKLLVNCTQGTVIRLLPAMNLTEEQAMEGCDILAEVIRQQANGTSQA